VHSLATTSATNNIKAQKSKSTQNTNAKTYSFSVPLINARPKPESFIDTFIELWNDPRSVTSLVATDDRSFVGERENDKGTTEEIPYCIISDEFKIENESFQILLYPRGRFVRDYSSTSTNNGSNSSNDGIVTGPASAYLRYLPKQYGDEIDIAWKLKLCAKDTDTSKKQEDSKTLSVVTSGGLPRSKDTWSAAMTFCTELEAVESVGRATDWGSSTWSAKEVCDALGNLVAEGEVTVFGTRKGESSFSWPPLSKGGIGAVKRAAAAKSSQSNQREFRVGEVIVPREMQEFAADNQALREQFIYPGVDYRIMTMTDKDGNSIFSTLSLDNDKERSQARLALRPCGWKSQQQLWKKNGMTKDWPEEVNAGLLSNVTLTRFNPESAVPRVVAAFQRDWIAYTFALVIALTPIPVTLLARNFVSLYVIPSASMEPTLLKGDVLLVEKLPGVYQRTKRGDVILFQPPPALRDIVTSNGSQLSSTSLFVKRIVGLPGDQNIHLVENNNVIINGEEAIGPDRNMCVDEPLRLIDKLLENGKGKEIDQLGANDVYVLGDCKAVSVDSRVFGILPKENIKGKPLARIWPLDRFKPSGPF
jgi:signal peptidase I